MSIDKEMSRLTVNQVSRPAAHGLLKLAIVGLALLGAVAPLAASAQAKGADSEYELPAADQHCDELFKQCLIHINQLNEEQTRIHAELCALHFRGLSNRPLTEEERKICGRTVVVYSAEVCLAAYLQCKDPSATPFRFLP